ncbi:MAG: response regulator transcription factor [Candidatus Saccharibacteria bacterium]
MKLLIVEDNYLLAASLKQQLQTSFIVDAAHNGAEAIEFASASNYGVIMLDLGLPDMNGREVCLKLREQGVMTPIIIATGAKDPQTCIELLDCGADDYVTKPYSIDVLRARVHALLRRSQSLHADELLVVGDLIVDTYKRHVERQGKPITLRRKEFDILEYLMRNRGRAVTRAMIFSHVWEVGKDSWNNTVDVHIKYLRDKIDKPFGTHLIKTAYGIGYMVDNSE